jgi:DNA-binding transcriptional MerR regulator
MAKIYSIGQLAKECDCKVQTLRYYEEIELIPKPERNSGNQRKYSEAHRTRLNFIRHSRQLGFTLDQIRQILSLTDNPSQPCDQVNAIAEAHLNDVVFKIERLNDIRVELERMVHACSGDKISECRIVEVLSDHSLCCSEH